MKQLFIALILSLVSATVTVAQGQPDQLAPTLAEARTLINEGHPTAAIAKLRALPNPTDVSVTHLLGIAYYHANDHVRAIAQLAPIVEQLPPDSLQRREAIQILGLSHYLAGHIPESVPFLEQARAWSANNTELAYVLGLAYVQTHQPAKARESFARMFRVAPDSSAAHLLTAQMMIRLEFEEFAEAELKQAIAKDPKFPQAHYLLGQLAIFRARYDEGIALMEREIEINPGFSMAYWRLGDAYTRQLKWDEAIPPLQKAIWLNPYFSGPFIILGKVYLKKKDLGNAEGMLRQAAQMDPNNASAHYLLGQVFQQTNRPEEAKREFALAEKLQGNSNRQEK